MNPKYSKFAKRIQRLFPEIKHGDTIKIDGKEYTITDGFQNVDKIVNTYIERCKKNLNKN